MKVPRPDAAALPPRARRLEKLQADIKSRFPVESDQLMFEAILRGASVTEVLE